jgi:hypothetical protein
MLPVLPWFETREDALHTMRLAQAAAALISKFLPIPSPSTARFPDNIFRLEKVHPFTGVNWSPLRLRREHHGCNLVLRLD